MANKESRPRISIEVESQELYDRLRKHLPWGTMSRVMNAIFKDLAHILEEHDEDIIIGAIVSEDVTLKEFLNKYEGKTEKEDG